MTSVAQEQLEGTGELFLRALPASNPLGFLAALGLLEVVSRFVPDATLSWRGTVTPRAVLAGVDGDEIAELVLRDAEDLSRSAVLGWPVERPISDVKISSAELSAWAQAVAEDSPEFADQWCGLAAEGGLDNAGVSKPSHLHFVAGQQRFLSMVRELTQHITSDRIDEALFGPWRYDSPAPSLSWDNRGERIYALRGTNPATDKRMSVPVANWLAFRGLSFYPTRARAGRLETAACDRSWKSSAFRWPVWKGTLTRDVAHSLVIADQLVGATVRVGSRTELPKPGVLQQLGIQRIYQARIVRTDSGGYGSFTPAEVLVEAN